MSNSDKVVILGAGPAGLAAGWKLSEKGVKVDVIELEDTVGGLCRSIFKDGFYFDLGGHRFITKDEEIQKELEDLMKDDFLLRQRKSIIKMGSKDLNYPLDIKDVLMKFNPLFSAKAFIDYVLTSGLQKLFPRPDSSFENWVINRFGVTLYNLYFGPYSEKLWGIPSNAISSGWADQRISLINLWDVFIRLFGKKKDEPKTYARQFYYPRKGVGQVFEMMSEKILRNDGEIHLNSKVKKILMDSQYKVLKIIFENEGHEKEVVGNDYISTIPLPDLIRMIHPRVEDKYYITADKMDFRSIRFLNLMINKPQITDNNWIYIPDEKYLPFRIQEWRNWSPTIVPEGKTALTLEIACDEGDNIWNAPDSEIFNSCIKDLEEMNFLKREDVIDYFSIRVKHCYPVYTLDYSAKVNTIFELLQKIPNLISIGRQGLYRYNNMDHSIKMGFLTARHLTEGLPKKEIFEIATEKEIFDWQEPGR